jgi:hypothetical protein
MKEILNTLVLALQHYDLAFKKKGRIIKRNFMAEDISSFDRQQPFVTARHLFCYICLENGYNLSAIARFLERDHTTIIHAVKFTKNRIQTKDNLLMEYINLMSIHTPHIKTALIIPKKKYSGEQCIYSQFRINRSQVNY